MRTPCHVHAETKQVDERNHRYRQGYAEPWSANRNLAGTGHIGDQRCHRAQEYEGRSDNKQNIIQQQECFPRQRLKTHIGVQARRAPCVKYQRTQDHNRQKPKDEEASSWVGRERVNRNQYS